MSEFGNLVPQVDLDGVSDHRRGRRLKHVDGRPAGSTRSSRETVQGLEPARGSPGGRAGSKRKAPSEPRVEAPAPVRTRLNLATRGSPGSGRTSSSVARASPTRDSSVLVSHKSGGAKNKQVEVIPVKGSNSGLMPDILKEGKMTEDTSFYNCSADAFDLLRDLHTSRDDDSLTKKTPVERQRQAAFYAWRAVMLLMSNQELVTQALEGQGEIQDSLLKSNEKVATLSSELALVKTKLVEAETEGEHQKSEAIRLKLRSDRLHSEVKELRETRDKLEGEAAAAEGVLRKKIGEARDEFQRQINEQATIYYKLGIKKGYDDCMADYDLSDAAQSPPDAEDASTLADAFPGLKGATSSSVPSSTELMLDHEVPSANDGMLEHGSTPSLVETVELDRESSPARVDVSLEHEPSPARVSAPGRDEPMVEQGHEEPTRAKEVAATLSGGTLEGVISSDEGVLPLSSLPPLDQPNLP